jgi:UTP pyrophosphatase
VSPSTPPALRYLSGYPAALRQQAQALVDAGTLGEHLARRYPAHHTVRTDAALYAYTQDLKASHMRSAPPLAKVVYAPRLHVIHNALGTHTTVARVQGGQLKAKREIRVSALFRDAPAEFLKMIVVHELAHLKEREHDKAFYALCCHMEPDYHQFEFDLRLHLIWLETAPATAAQLDDDPVDVSRETAAPADPS